MFSKDARDLEVKDIISVHSSDPEQKSGLRDKSPERARNNE